MLRNGGARGCEWGGTWRVNKTLHWGQERGTTTFKGKVGRQSGKVKLLFQLLPSLPFHEQNEFLSGFLPK